jgi:lysophospholipid acyltransferase (LPLAT)-like uncharacterized protein
MPDTSAHPSPPPDAVAKSAQKKSAIKGGTKEKIIGNLVGYIIQLLSRTLRIRFERPESFEALDSSVILVFWHGQIIPATAAWIHCCPRPMPLVALTSASKDGAIIEHTMSTFNVQSVRGSSSRRGTAALIELKKTLDAGNDICITPDGPRGPHRILQLGPLKLAQLTGVPILPLRVHCSSSWKLKTWDSFEIPKPFSTLYLSIDAPHFIPRKCSEEEMETLRCQIEGNLSLSDQTDSAQPQSHTTPTTP